MLSHLPGGKAKACAIGGFCFVTLMLWAKTVFDHKISGVLKSNDVDVMLVRTRHSQSIVRRPNYTVQLRVSSGWQLSSGKDRLADEFWFVRHGTAELALSNLAQNAGAASPDKRYEVDGGDIIHVPRSAMYKVSPGAGRFEYIAIQVFPSERHLPLIGSGSGLEIHPMPTVVRKSEIDATFAKADANKILYSAGAVMINYIVAPPSWPKASLMEAHKTCDDFYFIRFGAARIGLGGTIVHPVEEPAGEIHGSVAIGSREYALGPGDLVSIPRSTVHHLVPKSARFGYLLVKICD